MVQLPSTGSTALFVLLIALVITAFIAAHVFSGTGEKSRLIRNGLLFATVWLTVTGLASLAHFSGLVSIRIQPFVVATSILVGVVMALSPYGRRMATGLPLAALVAIHAYRLPLEQIIHRWWQEGFLPVQMTYTGDNFDIIAGAAALPFALLAWRLKNTLWPIWLFNIGGIALLVGIPIIVSLSADTPLSSLFGRYETGQAPEIIHFPYIWLPTVAAAGAMFFHIVLFRRLWVERGGGRAGS